MGVLLGFGSSKRVLGVLKGVRGTDGLLLDSPDTGGGDDGGNHEGPERLNDRSGPSAETEHVYFVRCGCEDRVEVSLYGSQPTDGTPPGRREDEVRKYAAITSPTECGTFIISYLVFFEVSEKDICIGEMYTESSFQRMSYK